MNDTYVQKTNIDMDLWEPLNNLGISKNCELKIHKIWLDKDMDRHLWILIQP